MVYTMSEGLENLKHAPGNPSRFKNDIFSILLHDLRVYSNFKVLATSLGY